MGGRVATGPQAARGRVVTVRFLGFPDVDAVAAPVLVRGPATVQGIRARPAAAGSAAWRVIPMAFPYVISRVNGPDLRSFLRAGIVLVRSEEVTGPSDGFPLLTADRGVLWLWPRVVVPWLVWAPGALVRTGAPGAVDVVVDFLLGSA